MIWKFRYGEYVCCVLEVLRLTINKRFKDFVRRSTSSHFILSSTMYCTHQRLRNLLSHGDRAVFSKVLSLYQHLSFTFTIFFKILLTNKRSLYIKSIVTLSTPWYIPLPYLAGKSLEMLLVTLCKAATWKPIVVSKLEDVQDSSPYFSNYEEILQLAWSILKSWNDACQKPF